MGDDNQSRRHHALFPKGIPAADYMQVFPPEQASNYDASSVKSILVAEIKFPVEIKLLSVLDICYAIQLDSEAKRYTLWMFNCYFFAWSIILILGRQVAQWESAFTRPSWDATCDHIAKTLESSSQNSSGKLAFKLEELLAEPGLETIGQIVTQYTRKQSDLLYKRAKSLLWTGLAPELIEQRVEHSVRHPIVEKTFRILFPEFGRFSLQSPITPVGIKPWERDQLASSHSPDLVSEYNEPNNTALPDTHTQSHLLPTLSEFIQAPMYQASSIVLSAVYGGVKMIVQKEGQSGVHSPIAIEDWHYRLNNLLTEAIKKDNAPALENQFLSLINAHPNVSRTEWRQALVQACDEQVPFFRSSPLPRLWDQWLWDVIDKHVCEVVGGLIPKSEPVNIEITRVSVFCLKEDHIIMKWIN
jgi:hypothetical protein